MRTAHEDAPPMPGRCATSKGRAQSSPLHTEHDILAMPVLEHALDLHDKGLAVVPAHGISAAGRCTCNRPDCPSPGKHPRVPWQEFCATRPTRDQIARWFSTWPDSNVAVITGRVSQVTVVDIDGPEGEQALTDAGVALPVTPTVKTGRGRHLYLAYDERLTTTAGLLQHVDVRNDGGIVIAPPSGHASGTQYHWADDLELGEVVLAQVPRSLVGLATSSPQRGARPAQTLLALATASVISCDEQSLAAEVAHWIGRVSDAASNGSGSRNKTLNDAAYSLGGLAYLGVDRDQVADRLAAILVCHDFGQREFDATLASGWEAGCAAARIGTGVRPHYPVDALPTAFADYVGQVASTLGVPPEMIAPALLAFAGATAGNGYRLLLEKGGDPRFGCWSERGSLWCITIAGAGAGKSPALRRARVFTDALQMRADRQHSEEMLRFAAELDEWESTHRRRGKIKTGPEAPLTFDYNPKPEPPPEEVLVTTDTTVEGLARALKGSRGVTLAVDEARSWLHSLGAYNGKATGDRAKYLSMWSGEHVRVTRAKSETISVADPVLGWVGGLQPLFCGEFILGDGLGDGLPQRLLWSWPDISPDVAPSGTRVSDASYLAAESVFERLRLPAGAACVDLRLSTEAQALFDQFVVECRQHGLLSEADGSSRGAMLFAGFVAKAPAHAARLALVLHLIEHEHPERHSVSASTLRNALRLVAFHALGFRRAVENALERAADATLERADSKVDRLSERLASALRNADGGWMSLGDLKNAAKIRDPRHVRDAALALLIDGGHAQKRERPSHTGTPTTEYRWITSTKEAA